MCARDHAGEERAAERLGAALHHADQDRQDEEVRRGRHEVAEDADRRVDQQAEEDRPLRADPAGQRAEQERERHADELHQQDRADQRALADADLGAVDRRHPDDGPDPVVVDQEREQHQEGLPEAAQLAEGLAEPGERGPRSRPSPGHSSGSSARGGSGTRRKSGIEKTTHQTATERKASRAGSVAGGSVRPGPRAGRTIPASGSRPG